MSKLDEITALQIQGNDVSLSEVLKTLLVSGKTRFLQSAAEELVTAKAAKSLGIEVDDEQLQQAADAYRRRRGMISIKATHAWLKQEGWTVDDFELHLERKLIRTQVVDQVASPEKIDAHFSEHRRDGSILVVSEFLMAHFKFNMPRVQHKVSTRSEKH